MAARALGALGVLLVLACCVLVTSRSVGFAEPDQALDADGSHREVAGADGAIVGNCTRWSRLLYTETVAVLKDSTSLVRGTVQIHVGQPITIHCVRVVALAESDRRALRGQTMLGTAAVEISIAEHPDFQSAALEYTVYVYGSYAPTKRAQH